MLYASNGNPTAEVFEAAFQGWMGQVESPCRRACNSVLAVSVASRRRSKPNHEDLEWFMHVSLLHVARAQGEIPCNAKTRPSRLPLCRGALNPYTNRSPTSTPHEHLRSATNTYETHFQNPLNPPNSQP